MPPALHTSKGVGRPPKLPLQPDSWTHPYPQLIQGTRSPPWGTSKGTVNLFLLPPTAAAAGIQALPGFLGWPLGEGQEP